MTCNPGQLFCQCSHSRHSHTSPVPATDTAPKQAGHCVLCDCDAYQEPVTAEEQALADEVADELAQALEGLGA